MPLPLKVLILEDRATDAQLVLRELRQSDYEPHWERVETEDDFLARLDAAWDLILADYNLPQFDAARALQHLHARGRDIPFIIVSGSIGEETAVAAIKQGATDYLLKDRLGRLGAAVNQALEQRQTREAQQLAEQSLSERTQLIMLSAGVGGALNKFGSLNEVLQECAQSLVGNLDAASAHIWTVNETERALELQATAGRINPLDSSDQCILVGAPKIGQVAAERTPIFIDNMLDDLRIGNWRRATQDGVTAFAGYPLLIEERLVGVMAIFTHERLSSATREALETIANQIAAGIERKRTEAQLQFTQFTIDHITTAVFWADENGAFFNVNEAACLLTGYRRKELLSLRVSDLDPAVSVASWPALWAELRKKGALAFETQLLRKDGSAIPISVYTNFLLSSGRECCCTLIQDISERKEAERTQQEAESRFHAIFNQLQLHIQRMPLGYVLYDDSFRVVGWNPAAEKIFGFTKQEVLCMEPPYAPFILAAERGAMEDIHRRLRQGDMSAHHVSKNLTKDGSIITCEWINTPLIDDEGRFSGLISLAQDVTERLRLEQQFRHAQKMEAVGKLAGGVAHDFNNLLTIILGYGEMVQESLHADDPLLELMGEIQNAGQRAARLTRQLLAFSRKQVLVPVVVDINALLMELNKMLSRLIGEDIDFAIQPCRDLWRVRVDPGQVEQVIMNLVVNARDAMPQGGKLTIETENVTLDENYAMTRPGARPGDYVLLAVSDTGCGMNSEVLAHIFEPFFTTKGPEHGTGLGLATVHGIVNQSGGHVAVYSEPNCGTTFKVYLPREQARGVVEEPNSSSKTDVDGTETILLVEDEDGVRMLARTTLQRHGYNVLDARNGEAALSLSEQYQGEIHLLATDVVMPLIGGRELAERLAKMRPQMKILFMSGYTDDAIVRHGLLNAEVPFLQKPYMPEALLRKVRKVLDASVC